MELEWGEVKAVGWMAVEVPWKFVVFVFVVVSFLPLLLLHLLHTRIPLPPLLLRLPLPHLPLPLHASSHSPSL